MDQLIYRNFFHAIAGNHLAIQNNEKDERFCEIVRSVDPLTGDWDSDFTSALRSRLKLADGKCAMVLEAIASEWSDRGGDNRELMPMASFIILKKTNYSSSITKALELSTCLAETQAVAAQIMAYLEEHNKRAWHSGDMLSSFYLKMNGCKFLPVPVIVDNIAGTRVEFDFHTPMNNQMIYDDQFWTDPLA